jgi:hypothetical protein
MESRQSGQDKNKTKHNMKNAPKIKKGDLIKVRLADGKLDGVVYTVQAIVRRGGLSLPVILNYWQPVIVTEFERA